MAIYGAETNEDSNGVKSTSEYGNPGDGTTKWYHWSRIADGGDATTGAKADAAVSDPTLSGSVVALLKGLLSAVRRTPYPYGATPIIGKSGVVANAVAAATLPAVASKTNYLSGLTIHVAGATAGGIITATVTGLLGGTVSYPVQVPTGVTSIFAPLFLAFDPPLPASAVNTAITVSLPAAGAGNTIASTVATGYYI